MAIRLNIGCAFLLMKGFLNLDINLKGHGVEPWDWKIPEGCELWDNFDVREPWKEILDKTVEAITISHMFYAIEETCYPFIFSEAYRTMQHGGVIRITEDNFDQPKDKFIEYGMDREGQITHVTRFMFWKYLSEAGFEVHDVCDQITFYKDTSLMQSIHGDYIKNFFIEGIKK